MGSIFFTTNTQKTLIFLIQFPGKQFIANEIQEKVKLSKGGLNQALRELAKKGFVNREQRGKVYLYSINNINPVIKQLKVLSNIELLTPLINKTSTISEKIILFGSSARGEDSYDSDIDIFFLTKEPDKISEIIKNYKSRRKIQPIIRTSVNYAGMEKKEPVFFEEISRGIVLWEKK